jgi:hypothetical protein
VNPRIKNYRQILQIFNFKFPSKTKLQTKMASIKSFNDFKLFQSQSFISAFGDVDKLRLTPKPKIYVKPKMPMSNIALMQTPTTSRTREEKAKQIIQKSIEEVKEKPNKSSSKFEDKVKVKLPKKDVKRLTNEAHKSNGKQEKVEMKAPVTGVAKRKTGNKVKIVSETIVFPPQFELIE